MNDRHCTDLQLLDARDAPSSGCAEHLRECSDCALRGLTLQTFTTDFLADKSIHLHALRRYPPAQPMDIRNAVADVMRGRAEYARARETVAILAARPIETWSAYLVSHSEALTDGLARRLIEAAREELEDHPARALDILEIAAVVASSLGDVFLLTEQRGNVAKERANALRLLNRYPEALASLDLATRCLSQLAAPTYDLAFIDWSRATVLFAMSRYAEALPLAQRVIRTFRGFGETYYAGQAQLLVANIFCEQGLVAKARENYLELLAYFETHSDRELVTRLHANLAECAARLDHDDEAKRYAALAIEGYRALRKPTEIVRVRWTLAYQLLRQGRYDAALSAFEEATAQFAARGVASAAAEVGLDIVEVHIARQEWVEAETLARYLADIFLRAQAPVHQTRALSDLRTAVTHRTATTAFVSEIRRRVTAITDAYPMS